MASVEQAAFATVEDSSCAGAMLGSVAARAIASIFLAVWIVLLVVRTWHWQQVNDPAQFQYVCFLMAHGMAPYRDLIEMNMPGIYLVHWGVIPVVGTSALAWRVFDLLLMIPAAWAMIAIARPYDWFAGVLSAALFILFHGRDGAGQMGQRDLIMAVLLVCAYAFLFQTTRKGRAWPMLGFGLASGIVVTIKPTPLPFICLLLVLLGIYLRRQGQAVLAPIAWACAGLVIPLAVVGGFLIWKHALVAFVGVVHGTLPYYARIGREGYGMLLQMAIRPTLWPLIVIALLIVLKKRDSWVLEADPRKLLVLAGVVREKREWASWEMQMLGLGLVYACVEYYAQGKTMVYHRYSVLAFVFLWTSLQFAAGLKRGGFFRVAGMAGIAWGLMLAPLYLREAAHKTWSPAYIDALTGDLNHLGGSELSGKVTCFSTSAECDTVLDRMQLVQSTGLFYDFLIFGPGNQPVIQKWRRVFWKQFEANPPEVMVVHTGLYPGHKGYGKLDAWPLFGEYLASHYALYAERSFKPADSGDMAYRIYVRKGMAGIEGNGGVVPAGELSPTDGSSSD